MREVNLNTVLLVVVFVMQVVVWVKIRKQRINNDKLDKAVRENLTVQTNYGAMAAELVRNYHHLTVGATHDAKEAMTTLAGEVKQTVATGVTNAAKVASAITHARDKKQEEIVAQMEVIHVATNSLVDRLITTEGEKKYAEGVKSETDKKENP